MSRRISVRIDITDADRAMHPQLAGIRALITDYVSVRNAEKARDRAWQSVLNGDNEFVIGKKVYGVEVQS